MKASASLLFWIGCIVIIISAAIQWFFPNLLTPLIIIIAVGFCIRQWHRKIREMNDLLAEEQQARRTADEYSQAQDQYIYAHIHTRMSPGRQQGKKKR
ncbi:MAG: hypothetical protein ABI456_19820 [Ktedonobacteraceae bacterium]|nr:hypothetical protein [Chloroflexota bacterium]